MTITNPFKEFKQEPVYTGNNTPEITVDELDEFLKNEIVIEKTCGCPMCNRKRMYHRRLQEIIKENTSMKNTIMACMKNAK